MSYRMLAIILVVLVAGCMGSGSVPTTTTPTPSDTPSATATKTPTTSKDRVPMKRGHPFHGEVLDVYVTDKSGYAYGATADVEKAISYWNEHSEEYGRYNASYRVTDAREKADIIVEFVEDVECGYLPDVGRRESLGCAPLINPYERFGEGESARIRISAGIGGSKRVQVIKHEFGHTLGLTHGMEPMPLMSETI